MDLFENAERPDNTPEFSVSELSGALRKTVEGAFSNIRVRGEIGRVTRPASGHIYLDLKDDKSVINCNIWRGVVQNLAVNPEEGIEVIVTGKLSTYAPQSKYNLIIESMEIAGEGALMALLEKRKRALAGEGLFDPARKKPLPFLPQRIGVITSRSGAVIRDIIHRVRDRYPSEIILWPVTVQGQNSANEVAAAIAGFNALPIEHPARPDVLIVARGGGSIEDLFGFNEEIVVRAAFASEIPLISAVGHETDTTLIDFVSDRRAPTPSAAAEMAVPVRADLVAALREFDARRIRSMGARLLHARQRLDDLARGLPKSDNILAPMYQRLDLADARLSSGLERRAGLAREAFNVLTARLMPTLVVHGVERQQTALDTRSTSLIQAMKNQITRGQQRLDRGGRLDTSRLRGLVKTGQDRLQNARSQLTPAFENGLLRKREQLHTQMRLVDALSYQNVLARGYAVIRDNDGKVLKDAVSTRAALRVRIHHADGITRAEIEKEREG